jgi:hypothetical protein
MRNKRMWGKKYAIDAPVSSYSLVLHFLFAFL